MRALSVTVHVHVVLVASGRSLHGRTYRRRMPPPIRGLVTGKFPGSPARPAGRRPSGGDRMTTAPVAPVRRALVPAAPPAAPPVVGGAFPAVYPPRLARVPPPGRPAPPLCPRRVRPAG